LPTRVNPNATTTEATKAKCRIADNPRVDSKKMAKQATKAVAGEVRDCYNPFFTAEFLFFCWHGDALVILGHPSLLLGLAFAWLFHL